MRVPVAAAGARLRGFLVRRTSLFQAVGWVSFAYAGQQVLRLATNVALARLLAPELLGMMLLVNTLRTGGELLSDVGIGQSIVSHRRGHERDFYSSAWTIQIVRGLLLFAIALAASPLLAHLYDEAQLRVILPAASAVFIIGGLASPARFLLLKRMDLKTLAGFNLGVAGFSAATTITLSFFFPSIWALIGGLLIGESVATLGSFVLLRECRPKLMLDGQAAKEILHFGKWVFVSSLIYFSASNFDRLYLADAVPFAVLGVYGVARTISDSVALFAQRLGGSIVLPKISAARHRGADLRKSLASLRLAAVGGGSLFLGVGVALADQFVILLYDTRYSAAAIYLPMLLVGTWFAVLSSIAESTLLGVGKPAALAAGNSAKFLLVVVAAPPALVKYGLVGAIVVFVAAEVARYVTLVVQQRFSGLAFVRQDALATAALLASIVIIRELTGVAGLTSGLSGWVAAVHSG